MSCLGGDAPVSISGEPLDEVGFESRFGEASVVLLARAKSLIARISRMPLPGSNPAIRNEMADPGDIPPITTTSAESPRMRVDPRASQSADGSNGEISKGYVYEETSVPVFNAETSAEEYFHDNQGKRAQGSFHEVEAVRWDHDEADWSIDEIESEPEVSADSRRLAKRHPHDKPQERAEGLQASYQPLENGDESRSPGLGANQKSSEPTEDICALNARIRKPRSETGQPTQKEIRSAVLRVRDAASEHRWLSPKSNRALKKIEENGAKLDGPEINALNYLLDRCVKVRALTTAATILRRVASK
jgi:hypothetical protein